MNKDEHPKGTIVQFHGNAENMSSHYLSLAWITARGYNLFTFDYRGYGQSDGNPDQAGLYRDALAALAQSWRFHIESKAPRFAVVGESLGGAVAMRALPDWLPHTRIDLIVMDSTFLSYRQVARRILARHWYTWLLQPLAYLLISDEYSATSAAAENRQKLLVIHDREDPVVPFVCGQDIFEQARASKDFWELNSGRHDGTFENPNNRDRFVKLLDAGN